MQIQTQWEREAQKFPSLNRIKRDKNIIDTPATVPVGGFKYKWIGHFDGVNRYSLPSVNSYLFIYNQNKEMIRIFFRS